MEPKRIKEGHGSDKSATAEQEQGCKSSNLFISTKTRIEQLEVEIAEVMGERSHDAWLAIVSMLQKSMLNHDIMYQQCYIWLREAKHSNINQEATMLYNQSTKRIAQGVISWLPRGSAHKKVIALICAFNVARATL